MTNLQTKSGCLSRIGGSASDSEFIFVGEGTRCSQPINLFSNNMKHNFSQNIDLIDERETASGITNVRE